jgi:hypothetical protein
MRHVDDLPTVKNLGVRDDVRNRRDFLARYVRLVQLNENIVAVMLCGPIVDQDF